MNVLLGPTLSGKTTLMRLMAGLDRPTTGRLIEAAWTSPTFRCARRSVAMVYQQFVNYPSLTVYREHRLAAAGRRRRARRDRRARERSRAPAAARQSSAAPARATLRRPAAAHRDRARPRQARETRAARRAARQSRLQAARGIARGIAAHLRRRRARFSSTRRRSRRKRCCSAERPSRSARGPRHSGRADRAGLSTGPRTSTPRGSFPTRP